MKKILLKTPSEIEIMAEGGAKLAKVKNALRKAVRRGVNAGQIEELADELIEKEGGQASFKMVEGYKWATCVNVNSGVVHGIPKKDIVFETGDVVSVDVGMFYRGFHTDTSFSVGIETDRKLNAFLETGRKALKKAISQVKVGNKIYDISDEIESTLRGGKYSPVRALVGHGVGRDLHEEPQIPCFRIGKRDESPQIEQGAVLAVEVMYAMGKGDVFVEDDGWTISTSDGTISALFEETVAATLNGPLILT